MNLSADKHSIDKKYAINGCRIVWYMVRLMYGTIVSLQGVDLNHFDKSVTFF